MMVFIQSTTHKIIYTDSITYMKLETNLMLYFMRLDKAEEIISTSVKTLQT
jgi:hypothetical protein